MPIAAVIDGSTFAVHSDHLNTPRKLTDASGQPVWQWSYSAFGEDKPTTARNRFANLDAMPNPGTTNFSDVKFNLRYSGQYSDEESGLFYNYFRSYGSEVGRYLQADPSGLAADWNRFGYVNGNPLLFTDPFGLQGRSGGLFYPRGEVITGPPVMAENGGWATPRSMRNQFTNMPNAAKQIPGQYVGVNYPWSMPNLMKVCDAWGPYPEPNPNAGNMCRPPAPGGGQGPFISSPGQQPVRACLSLHVEESP